MAKSFQYICRKVSIITFSIQNFEEIAATGARWSAYPSGRWIDAPSPAWRRSSHFSIGGHLSLAIPA